jgi:hypothetical protein
MLCPAEKTLLCRFVDIRVHLYFSSVIALEMEVMVKVSRAFGGT